MNDLEENASVELEPTSEHAEQERERHCNRNHRQAVPLFENPLELLEVEVESTEMLRSLVAEEVKTSERLKTCQEQLIQLGTDVRQLKTEKAAMDELSQRYEKLREGFHERELLKPICLQLISVADRCRQGEEQIASMLDRLGEGVEPSRSRFLRGLLQARAADRVDIETLLANLGVEMFEVPEDSFAPSMQKCVGRVPCEDVTIHGRIANRLRPGYRRNGDVIRHEYVRVYVTRNVSEKKGQV